MTEATKKYIGECLCKEISYESEGEPVFPHLCSCTMCQKSSGAPTVAWLEFPLKNFKWTGKTSPVFYQSSEKTKRCFCPKCGSFLGAVDKGYENISITITSLKNPNLIIPAEKHSYKESAPSWWKVHVLKK